MIDRFVNLICGDLGIDPPSVVTGCTGDTFSTSTMQAVCDGRTIRLRGTTLTPDTAFAIAHELRHMWQIKTDEEYYFSGYKPADKCSLREYNLQEAELDANAYAGVVMGDLFGLKPLFHGVPDDIKATIYERMKRGGLKQ